MVDWLLFRPISAPMEAIPSNVRALESEQSTFRLEISSRQLATANMVGAVDLLKFAWSHHYEIF